MRQLYFGACALLFAAPASAAKFMLYLQPTAQQSSRMESGIAAVDDSMATSSVRLFQPEGDLKKRGSLQLMLMNQGTTPFNFGAENVSGSLADGTPIVIIPYEKLAREERSRARWRQFGAALATMNSGHYSSTGAYRGSLNGMIGSTPYYGSTYGTATVSGTDPLAAAIENKRIFDNVAARNAAGRQALEAYIRTTTVDPQKVFGGAVTFELPKTVHTLKGDVPLTFVVTVNGEQHRFNAFLRRQ